MNIHNTLYTLICTFIWGTLMISLPTQALAEESSLRNDYTISQYDVELDVKKDGSLMVKEDITYDFGKKNFSFMQRGIPLGDIRVDIQEVDLNNRDIAYDTSQSNGNLVLETEKKPDQLTGTETLSIEYTVQGLVRDSWNIYPPSISWRKGPIHYYEEYDEVYWNAIGDEWDVPIENSQVVVNLPQEVSSASLQSDCYTGEEGNTDEGLCSIDTREDERQVIFTLDTTLNQEFFTVATGFEPGVIDEVSRQDKFNRWALSLIFPGVIFLGLIIWRLQVTRERRSQVHLKRPIVRQYLFPKDLRPAQVSRVYHGQQNTKEFSSTIIDLAVRGIIHIREEEASGWFGYGQNTCYVILQDENYHQRDDLEEYEREILDLIFDHPPEENKEGVTRWVSTFTTSHDVLEDDDGRRMVDMNALAKKHVFASKATSMYKKITRSFSKDDYINSSIVRYVALNLLIGVGTLIGGVFIDSLFNVWFWTFGGIVTALLVWIMSAFAPTRTQKGLDVYGHMLGFKKYIEVAEKDRLKFQEDEQIFFENLPYAMVLGIVDKYSKAFEDIITHSPDWYEGTSTGFSSVGFQKSMNSLDSSIGKSFTSSSSGGGSSGGGSAGGGSGGGGGGAG